MAKKKSKSNLYLAKAYLIKRKLDENRIRR